MNPIKITVVNGVGRAPNPYPKNTGEPMPTLYYEFERTVQSYPAFTPSGEKAKDGVYLADRIFQERMQYDWCDEPEDYHWQDCVIDGYDPILKTGYEHRQIYRTIEPKEQKIDMSDVPNSPVLDYYAELGKRMMPAQDESVEEAADTNFQSRVLDWLIKCFGTEIAKDILERNDRFIEESLELAQSLNYSADRAHALVDYVFNRPKGEPFQEVGGVMVTLAALCSATGLNMHIDGEIEFARINKPEIIEKIRAKQKSKPTGSALPIPFEQESISNLPDVSQCDIIIKKLNKYNERYNHGLIVQAMHEYATLQSSRLTAMIEELEKRQKWVSVKDRLPDEGQKVLVVPRSDGSIMMAEYNRSMFERYVDVANGERVYVVNYPSVTHWIPLPEKPLTQN